MRRGIRENSLSIAFLTIFLAALVGESIAGWRLYNQDQHEHGGKTIAYLRYLYSSDFGSGVLENWQSEYLQFLLYILATVWLVQKGSSESKDPGDEGTDSERAQRIGRHAAVDSPTWASIGGWRTALYSRSLGLLMGGLFLLTWAASAVAGWAAFNSQQLGQRQDPVTFLGYLGEADFWNRSFQNWQSEMLAVGSMAVFSVYLRQRGSPESKLVGAAHHDTGRTG